uniref:Uncharacterized protein n=1 Tax=Arundo donax TaxID=35708 RepID=A0A0A8Z4B2_ARUDO
MMSVFLFSAFCNERRHFHNYVESEMYKSTNTSIQLFKQ